MQASAGDRQQANIEQSQSVSEYALSEERDRKQVLTFTPCYRRIYYRCTNAAQTELEI